MQEADLKSSHNLPHMLLRTENCPKMKPNSDLREHPVGSGDKELPEVPAHDINSLDAQLNATLASNKQLCQLNNANHSEIFDDERVVLSDPVCIKNNSIDELLQKISYQQNVIDQHADTIKFLEEKCSKLETFRKDMELKLENSMKQKDAAIREKENMVIRYAVGEKNVMKERSQKDQVEKKFKDLQKEHELLQHKLQTMFSEKSRICQMLDNKCYEYKNVQLELDKAKQDLNNLETKLKWNQNSLKNEIEAHRECQARVDNLNARIQDSVNQIDIAKKSAEETVRNFMTSQENKAYVLDQQLKEQQASLILLRHEKSDKDQHIKSLQSELDRLQSKQKETIEENNNLSLKVQHLERERLENEQKLSELRGYQDLQRQDAADLQTKNVQFEQLKLQLKHEEEQLLASNEQMELLKQRNQELESDMESCRVREAELLLFTQQLTDKNVRLQSEFTAVETKVQQLTCEQTALKRQLKEHETRISILYSTLEEEKSKNTGETEILTKTLEETRKKLDIALRDVADQQGENVVMKRKFDLSLREVNKELQHCRRKLEQYEAGDSSTNTSNSSSSLNVNGHSSDTEQVKVIQPEPTIDKQTLIEHIVKLQRLSAKKSEKIDFLEEHVNTLVLEIQKKTKLLQGYVLREQAGTLSSNSMDNNKSGLLMSVIRTLSASETNEQRDREKAKLEADFKVCDQKLDRLVSHHENDLTKVMHLFGTISQSVTENRDKIHKVKEMLQDCKKKLRCKRDELKALWMEGLEYKYMLQLLQEIEKMSNIPSQLATHMSHKRYLHATKLLVEAVQLGKDPLEGVESLKELSHELEQRKEQLHLQILSELKNILYTKPCQHILTLRRQGSGRDGFLIHSPLQRSLRVRLSGRNRSNVSRNLMDDLSKVGSKDLFSEHFNLDEDLDNLNIDENNRQYVSILVKSLCLLEKLPYTLDKLVREMQASLTHIIQKSTQHVIDFAENVDSKLALKELINILFDQFKEIADSHLIFLKWVDKGIKKHRINLKPYTLQYYWSQVQEVLQILLNDYLDLQNMSTVLQIDNAVENGDISAYFSRRKQQSKKKSLFKFEGSSSALSLSNALKSSKKEKVLICSSHPNNILVVFIPFMCFTEDIEQMLGIPHASCSLYGHITQHISNVYLKQKSEEIIEQVENAFKAADAWKSTVLWDVSAGYKPLLVSTVTVERCIREWKAILQSLPLYSEKIADYSVKALKEYKETCYAAYRGMVQPHSEDKRICSAAWLKDEDINRFLKSLPNWLNLKAQQEFHARSERGRKILRDQPSEEESPEDVRMRNRKEAEILASNLGEGGVSASEILSDMSLLKELATLQESMEWFSVRMFQYTSEFRLEPSRLSPLKPDNNSHNDLMPPVSSATLHQLTSIAQEFDELANTCLLLLHLEVRVQCFHYLLAHAHYNKETHEPDPKVSELSKVLANVDEAMTTSLHPRKCKYIFEGLGHLIAKILISSAQYMQVINDAGIQRMCRNIFALQQTLTNITMTRELALDHARHYFELFFLTPEEILNGIVDKGPEFSELEYMNALQLLNRSQKNKDSSSVTVHLERLSDILGEVGVTV